MQDGLFTEVWADRQFRVERARPKEKQLLALGEGGPVEVLPGGAVALGKDHRCLHCAAGRELREYTSSLFLLLFGP